MIRILGMLHAPGALLSSGATWLHCAMLLRHSCCSNKTSFLQRTTCAAVVQVVLYDCESQKSMVALAGSGRWAAHGPRWWGRTLPSTPNGGLGSDLENLVLKHPDCTGLLNLPVVTCNCFICICCRMTNSAHFHLRLSSFLLVSPYNITHSKHFWPHNFFFFN